MSDASNPEQPGKPAVGYGRPPVQYRFKTGASGNPLGRPRKPRYTSAAPSEGATLADLIYTEAYRPVTILENGKPEAMPMIQAVLRSLGVSAARGSHRAQLAITSLIESVETRRLNEEQALFEATIEYKKHWREVFDDCDRRGAPRPAPIPHPDDLAVAARTGEVIFNGPLDDTEKALWDQQQARAKEALKEVAYYKKKMKRSKKSSDLYVAEVKSEQELHELITGLFPVEEIRRAAGFNIHEWREMDPAVRSVLERRRKQAAG